MDAVILSILVTIIFVPVASYLLDAVEAIYFGQVEKIKARDLGRLESMSVYEIVLWMMVAIALSAWISPIGYANVTLFMILISYIIYTIFEYEKLYQPIINFVKKLKGN